MTPVPEGRRAALARDGALRRLRRSTQISIAAIVALGGAFTAFAAGSTHTKTATAARRTAAPAPTVVVAPAPPLVATKSAASATPTPTQAPAAAAPTPTYQPPVVSSGGS